MADPVEGSYLDPRQTALVMEVYEAALRVAATFPERHVASVAARKIIAAFTSEVAHCRHPSARLEPLFV